MKILAPLFSIFILSYSMKVDATMNAYPEFNATKCIHGHASRWVNACVCDNPFEFSGKYCSEKPLNICTSNNDCPKEFYCLNHQNKGRCFKSQVRNILETEKAFYALSDNLLSYTHAANFCTSLGVDFRPISRKDLNCQGEGAGCLDKEICLKLQATFGIRGFFWLDKKAQSDNAYYADLNDGTVYNTQQDNIRSNQVLCIREKK